MSETTSPALIAGRHLVGMAVVALLLPISAQAQSIFKCPDANGRMQYTDKPCGGSVEKNRVRVNENALDGSHARREVQRWKDEREQAALARQQQDLMDQRTGSQDSYECRLAMRNAQTQSVNAPRGMWEAEMAQARAVCGLPQPAPEPRRAQVQTPPPPAPAQPPPESQQVPMNNCNASGCWGTDATRYNRTSNGNFFRQDGKFCTQVGSMIQCN